MKLFKLLLPLALLVSSFTAHAEMQEVTGGAVTPFIKAVHAIKLQDVCRDADGYTQRVAKLLGYVKSSQTLFFDKTGTEPALIFRYKYENGYAETLIYTTADQKNITSVSYKAFELQQVNNGTLVEPLMAMEYVIVTNISQCKM